MKLAFIVPAIGKKPGQPYINTWKMEPLMISMLKALTPEDIHCVLFDDRIELIDYDADVDAVAITVETYTAKRAYFIANEFKKRGKKIIMGGYHVTCLPGEARQYADTLIIGNAEPVWRDMIIDLTDDKLKAQYNGACGFSRVMPDKTIYSGKKYIPVSLIETGRGCRHSCEFCSITSYYNASYYLRNIDDIVEEIKKSDHSVFFFVDDNMIANKQYAMDLFDAITPLKIKWAGQGSILMAADELLLKKMKTSGCQMMLIGFESLEPDNLKQMNKQWNAKLGDMDTLVKNIHKAGINIYATFLLGFDYDNPEIFTKTMRFARRHKFFFAAFNHLLPFPATLLYERLKEEDRLSDCQWWLADNYIYGDIPFMPKNMTPEQVSHWCEMARKKFYSLPSLLTRFVKLFQRKPSLFAIMVFLGYNLQLGKEVGQKMRIPLGAGLDELPK
jgi:radical SAM superfamily enzyme YgiQ (UPF0313 family)